MKENGSLKGSLNKKKKKTKQWNLPEERLKQGKNE